MGTHSLESQERRNRFGFFWHWLRDIGGQCVAVFCTPQEWPVWYGSIYRVLTACSRGTHGVLTGYSRGTQRECTGARASVGRVLHEVRVRVLTWAVRAPPNRSDSAFSRGGSNHQRSLAHRGVGVVWCGTSRYSQGTHGVLKQYRVSETGVLRRRGVDVSHGVGQSIAPLGLCGVLTGYSTVLTRYSGVARAPPSAECKRSAPVRAPRALRLCVIGL
jgi:hypothetical protein